MLKYAKIIDENTKLCDVGIGTNSEYYESIGMTIQDVEESWNGTWYLKGYVPEKPEEVIKAERIEELKALLAAADYWGQKYIDGEYTEEEWEVKKAQRKAWREEIRSLENETLANGDNSGG